MLFNGASERGKLVSMSITTDQRTSRPWLMTLGAVAATITALCGAAAPSASAAPPAVFDPSVEAQNFAITQQRQAIYDTPAYQAQLAADSVASGTQALATEAADPGRFFTDDLCWNLGNGCAGDIRLNNWAGGGYGLVRPVLFTARNGATISGHVWATVAGPARRPGMVITNGSVQADEQMYWYAAQTLAKAGYVVLTFDPQGQGQSDTYGQSPDQNEGVPAQTDGRPFYDGTEDAINFLLSSPQRPYAPVASCSTGTSHTAKQNDRAKAGLNAAYDPFWQLLDGGRVGLVGHSYGAAGVSYIAQWDPRVGAVVALDNLGGAGPNAGSVPGAKGGSIGEQGCPANPANRTVVPITKPALGISADYGLPPTPNTSLPDPTTKELQSKAYTAAGVDSGEIVIRGGSHLDFSFIPNQAFGASLRGPDITDWYATAWFDKYLRHDPGADARLLTERWRHDPVEAGVDPGHDGNAFSFYYHSRLDVHLAGGSVFDCEHLRDGCIGMVAGDGYTGSYSYYAIDTTPDATQGPGAALVTGSRLTPCTGAQRITIRLRRLHRRAITKVVVYVDHRLVRTVRGRSLRSVTISGLPGAARHTVRVYPSTRTGRARRTVTHVYGCAHRAPGHPRPKHKNKHKHGTGRTRRH
jgi:dienelactone hydrolase